MTAPKSSKPRSSKPKPKSPEKVTYRNVYPAAISPVVGVKIAEGETIELTEKEAEACGGMLERA